LQPGDIVIMENLGSHKSKAVRHPIRAASARLFYLTKSIAAKERLITRPHC